MMKKVLAALMVLAMLAVSAAAMAEETDAVSGATSTVQMQGKGRQGSGPMGGPSGRPNGIDPASRGTLGAGVSTEISGLWNTSGCGAISGAGIGSGV